MIIVDVQQRSPEWLALRRGAITASSADRLLTPAKLKELALELATERLVRELPVQAVTTAMQWGIDHEDAARLRYAFERQHVAEIGFAWLDGAEGWIGCSPDGLVGDDGLVEIKCPSSKRHLEYLIGGACPKDYLPQVQFQMLVTGRAWCDFVSFDPRFEHSDFFCVRVERDDSLIIKLRDAALACAAQIESILTTARAA